MKRANPVKIIRDMVKESSQNKVAEKFGTSQSMISDILKGAKPPTKSMLRQLGIEKQTIYVYAD